MPSGRYPVAYKQGQAQRPSPGLSKGKVANAFLGPLPALPPAVLPVAAPIVVPATAPITRPVLLATAGFAVGVGIGLLIWGNPFDSPPPNTGAEGWHNAWWTYTAGCPDEVGTSVRYSAGGFYEQFPTPHYDCTLQLPVNSPTTNNCGGNWENPQSLIDFCGPPVIYAHPYGGVGLTARAIGMWQKVAFSTEPDTWTQYPGTGTPLVLPAEAFPSTEPAALPILKPVGNPIPQKWDNAVADPGTQPLREEPTRIGVGTPLGPVIIPFPAWPITIVPITVETPGTGTPVPVETPTQEISVDPSGEVGGSFGTPPGTKWPSAPTEGKKERKVNVRSVSGAVWPIMNAASEALDFLDVLWGAIPGRFQTKDTVWKNGKPHHQKPAPHVKLKDIYEAWDAPDFDAATFVELFINNQVEDMYYGLSGQQSARASQAIGLSTGLDRATGKASSADWGGSKSTKGGKEKVELGNPVPVLDYDPKDGSWAVHWELLGIDNFEFVGASK